MLVDSGSKWIGKVPTHWEISKIGHCFNHRNEIVSDKGYEPLSVTKNGILPQLETAAKSDNSDGRKLIRRGDFVINQRSDRKGSAGVSPLDGSCSVIYTVLEPTRYHPAYAHHLFRSTAFQEEFYRWGTGIVDDLWSTRYSLMRQISCPVPPLDEQKAIADFLDQQLLTIDNLIEKQKGLGAALERRRSSLIQRCVTKGMPKNVRMRKTNTFWLGEVPEHWQLGSLKRFANTGAGAGFPIEFQGRTDEEIPFLKVNSLAKADTTGIISIREDTVSRATARQLGAKIYPAGSIVMAKIGAALLLGRVRTIFENSCIDNNMMAIFPKTGVLPRFLYYLLQQIPFGLIVNPGAVPSTSEGAVSNVQMVLPPMTEQVEIADYLDRETSQIDRLLATNEEMLDKLTERKSALISAAVTGKIDVWGE